MAIKLLDQGGGLDEFAKAIPAAIQGYYDSEARNMKMKELSAKLLANQGRIEQQNFENRLKLESQGYQIPSGGGDVRSLLSQGLLTRQKGFITPQEMRQQKFKESEAETIYKGGRTLREQQKADRDMLKRGMVPIYEGGQRTGEYELTPEAAEERGLDIQTKKARLAKLRAKGGKGAGKILPASATKPFQDAVKGLNMIKSIGTKLKTPASKEIMGPISGLLAKSPFADKSKVLQAQLDTVKQVIGKAVEGGVLRKEDEEKYKKILPIITDRHAVAENKVKMIITMMKQDIDVFLDTQEAAGYNVRNLRGVGTKYKKQKTDSGTGNPWEDF